MFRKFLADDYRGVYSDGMKSVDQEIAAMNKSDLKSFSFSDVTVSFPDKDTALLTYKVTGLAQGGWRLPRCVSR